MCTILRGQVQHEQPQSRSARVPGSAARGTHRSLALSASGARGPRGARRRHSLPSSGRGWRCRATWQGWARNPKGKPRSPPLPPLGEELWLQPVGSRTRADVHLTGSPAPGETEDVVDLFGQGCHDNLTSAQDAPFNHGKCNVLLVPGSEHEEGRGGKTRLRPLSPELSNRAQQTFGQLSYLSVPFLTPVGLVLFMLWQG
jgi:hypothetical protein